MITAYAGFRKCTYVSDCYGGGSLTDIPCPRCGKPVVVEYECRMRRPPSIMTAVCNHCNVWFDLGTSPLTNTLDVSREAVRRAKEKLCPTYVQSTLEAFA